MKTTQKWITLALSGALALSLAACSQQPVANSGGTSSTSANQSDSSVVQPSLPEGALVIKEQGIFSAGGIVVTSDGTFDPENHFEETGAGQTTHADHANVLYQIPAEETGLPMVFLHG